jgi:cell division protein FtsQ
VAELDSNGQRFSEQISEIDLSDPADARVLMPEQDSDIMAHFGQDHFLERYQRYKGHIADWRQQYPKLAAVDLRYDQQVVLEMASGTNAAQAGEQSAESASADPGPSGQVAENGQVTHEKHTSGAKARNASIGSMRGLKPPPPSVKAKTKPAGKDATKVKAAATKKTDAKTSASAVKVNTTTAKKTNAKTRASSVNVNTQNKKRAAGKRAALNVSKQKTAPTTPSASSAGQGQ